MLPSKFKINIKEKEIVGILKNETKSYYIDEQVNIIDKVKENINYEHVVINTEFEVDNKQKINFNNENDKNSIVNILKLIELEGLDRKINNIDLYSNNVKIKSENIEYILEKSDNLNYDMKRVSKIMIDLQNKNIKNGTVDLTDEKYAIYRP